MALGVIALLSSCSIEAGSSDSVAPSPTTVLSSSPPDAGAPQPSASMPASLIVADPVEVLPGHTVELTFPQETVRGIGWAMEQPEDTNAWRHLYDLVSDRRGGPPVWQPAGGDIEIDLVAITGPGPDTVLIPDVAEAGDYRICTQFVEAGFCTALRVLPSS